MSKNLNENQWLEDFNEFISAKPSDPPQALSEKILMRTKKIMNPSPWLVFLKLLGIHSIFGTLSLSLCNQFGLNPFNTSLSLSEYFMTFGHSVCMSLCGVIFVGFSVLVAWLVLNRDEFNIIKENFFIQIFSLGFLSLATFVALGAHVTFSIAVVWLMGAFVGGAIPTWALVHKKISFA